MDIVETAKTETNIPVKTKKPVDDKMLAGYDYVLTEVTEERYKPKTEEELIEAQNKLKRIKSKITERVGYFKSERRKNKIRAFILRVLSTFLAAVVTILLGLNFQGLEKTFNTVALVISGFLTVIGILQKLLDSKDLWVQYTSVVGNLEALLFSIEYLEEGKNAIRLKDVEFIKFKYDKIMNENLNFIVKVRADVDAEE